MQLRVRSLYGAELVVDVPKYTVRLQVAEIKRLSLRQLLLLRAKEELQDEETKEREPVDLLDDDDKSATLHEKMEGSCLVFRGQILADTDDVNLFAVVPSDFFVLVEDMHDTVEDLPNESDESMHDNENDKETPHKRRRATATRAKQEVQDASVMQLMEMGFDLHQAQNALELSRGELSRAVALLMGEAIASTESKTSSSDSSRLRAFVAKLIQRYPGLAAIESLLLAEPVHKLKKIAATSDFDAFVMLKESFPAHWLAQMNENPAAMVLFLSLPHYFESSTAQQPHKKPLEAIDLTTELEPVEASVAVPVNSKDQDAIERLASMGFAPDLVAAIYESCGGNEEIAANLLLETLS